MNNRMAWKEEKYIAYKMVTLKLIYRTYNIYDETDSSLYNLSLLAPFSSLIKRERGQVSSRLLLPIVYVLHKVNTVIVKVLTVTTFLWWKVFNYKQTLLKIISHINVMINFSKSNKYNIY